MKFIISNRSDGTTQFVGGEVALANREKFLAKQGIDPKMVVAGQLVNGSRVQIVGRESGGEKMIATDGLITTDPELWLSITVADCLPIVIYGEGVVALLHGGWRGLDAKIIGVAVKTMREILAIQGELSSYIGVGIARHHYPVAKEVAEKFFAYPSAIEEREGQNYLDLREVAKQQLQETGITKIEIDEACTYCESDKYLSARRDQTNPVEVMMVLTNLS